MNLGYLLVLYIASVIGQVRESVDVTSDDFTVTSMSEALGEAVQINCTANDNIEDYWLRNTDSLILAYGKLTYTPDYHYWIRREKDTNLSSLPTESTTREDSMIYACQTKENPEESQISKLILFVQHSETLGGPNVYLSRGSNINITCVIKTASKQVIWRFNNEIIGNDNPRGGLTMTTLSGPGRTTMSTLLLRRSKTTDSGEYQCTADGEGGLTASANVHITDDQ